MYLLSRSLFNVKAYIDDSIQNCQMNLPEHFIIGHYVVGTFLFADDQAILSISKSGLQMAVHLLHQVCEVFGL